MKRLLSIGSMLSGLLLLSGCQSCLSSWCMGAEAYQRMRHPRPYVELWEKAGMTPEKRIQDWVGCGGSQDGDFSMKTKEQLPGETDHQSYTRQSHAHERCMVSRGYHYTGDCKGLETSPLCGAP